MPKKKKQQTTNQSEKNDIIWEVQGVSENLYHFKMLTNLNVQKILCLKFNFLFLFTYRKCDLLEKKKCLKIKQRI